MGIWDFDPLLKKRAEQRAAKAAEKQVPKTPGSRSYNSMPLSLGIGQKQYKASDVSSAAELGRALKPRLDDIARDFRDYVRRVEDVLPDDMVAALQPTMALSLIYVPKDTGELANSAYLETRSFRGQIRVEMGYGRGGSPDYAVYVHEIPYKHAEPTSWKFLEKAVDEDWAGIVQRVTDFTRMRLAGR